MKYVLEISLFIFILLQIVSLTSFTGKDDPAKIVQDATIASVQAFVEKEKLQKQNSFDQSNAQERLENQKTLHELAEEEAMDIIQSGRVDEFKEKLDKNKHALSLLGYSY